MISELESPNIFINNARRKHMGDIENVVRSIVQTETGLSDIDMVLMLPIDRLAWQHHPDKSQVLLLDGNPILKLYPPEFKQEEAETGHIFKMTQRYERLQNKNLNPT